MIDKDNYIRKNTIWGGVGVEKNNFEEKSEKINKFDILSQNTNNVPTIRDEKSDYSVTEDDISVPPPGSGYSSSGYTSEEVKK